VQDQIDASVEMRLTKPEAGLGKGDGLTHCEECGRRNTLRPGGLRCGCAPCMLHHTVPDASVGKQQGKVAA